MKYRLLKAVLHWCVAASFIATLLMLLAYVSHFQKNEFNSDDASVSMLAQSMWDQGRLFPSGWVSNNGDLMMPSMALIVAPLLCCYSNSFELHAVGSIAAIVILLAAWFACMRAMRMARMPATMGALLLASGVSPMFTHMVYAQTTYVWLAAGILLVAATTLRYRACQEGIGHRKWIVATSLLIFLLSLNNPMRIAVMVLLPAYAFDRALHWPYTNARGRSQKLGLHDPFTLSALIAFAAAFSIYKLLFLFGEVSTRYFAAQLQWTNFRGVLGHARVLVDGWFDYLGARPEQPDLDAPLESLTRVLRTLIACWLTWVGCTEPLSLRTMRDPVRRAFVVAFLATLPLTLLAYLGLASLADTWFSLRYFTVTYCLLFVLGTYRLADWLLHASRRHLVALISVCFGLVATAVIRFIPFGTGRTTDFWGVPSSSTMRLAAILREAGLHYGYATYWNAEATTVLSGGAVRVSPVELGQETIFSFPVLRLDAWYAPDSWPGETFVALAQQEAGTQATAMLERQFGKPERTLETADFRIYVYDHNVMRDVSR